MSAGPALSRCGEQRSDCRFPMKEDYAQADPEAQGAVSKNRGREDGNCQNCFQMYLTML